MSPLAHIHFDPALAPGAHNAVHACLRIQPGEKVTLITDHACLEIAAALTAALRDLGAPHQAFILEDLVEILGGAAARRTAQPGGLAAVLIFAFRIVALFGLARIGFERGRAALRAAGRRIAGRCRIRAEAPTARRRLKPGRCAIIRGRIHGPVRRLWPCAGTGC